MTPSKIKQRAPRPGFRYFKCDECEDEWMAASRDVDSPSGDECACGVWVHARPATTAEFDRLRKETSTFNADVAASAIIKHGDAMGEIDKLKKLVVRCYRAIHRNEWQDGETESELSDAINDQMHSLYGDGWSR